MEKPRPIGGLSYSPEDYLKGFVALSELFDLAMNPNLVIHWQIQQDLAEIEDIQKRLVDKLPQSSSQQVMKIGFLLKDLEVRYQGLYKILSIIERVDFHLGYDYFVALSLIINNHNGTQKENGSKNCKVDNDSELEGTQKSSDPNRGTSDLIRDEIEEALHTTEEGDGDSGERTNCSPGVVYRNRFWRFPNPAGDGQDPPPDGRS